MESNKQSPKMIKAESMVNIDSKLKSPGLIRDDLNNTIRSQSNLSGLDSDDKRSKAFQSVRKRLILDHGGSFTEKPTPMRSPPGAPANIHEEYFVQKIRMAPTKEWKDIVINRDLRDMAQLQIQIQKEYQKIERKKAFSQYKDTEIEIRRK